jgi:hypothetical protein
LCAGRDARKKPAGDVVWWQSMSEAPKSRKDLAAEARRRRLAAELRANLAKRKAQSRARTAIADVRGVTSGHRSPDRSDRS